MTIGANIVFLFDCDNTLLDNDGVQEDLRAHLDAQFGAGARDFSLRQAGLHRYSV